MAISNIKIMQTTFITDTKGNKLSAVLPIKKYLKLLEDLEELEDIRLYDSVKSRKEKPTSFDSFVKEHKARKKANA
jgi:hypothetical protein